MAHPVAACPAGIVENYWIAGWQDIVGLLVGAGENGRCFFAEKSRRFQAFHVGADIFVRCLNINKCSPLAVAEDAFPGAGHNIMGRQGSLVELRFLIVSDASNHAIIGNDMAFGV